MRSWGKFWTQKIQRDQKPQLPLLKSLEQKQGVGSKSRVLRMPPAHNPKGVGETPKPALPPDPWTRPYPHPIEGTSSAPTQGSSKQGNLLFALAPPLLQQGTQ